MSTFSTQSEEFLALDELIKRYKALQNTPIVDDDYTEQRFHYERSLMAFLRAAKSNGRKA